MRKLSGDVSDGGAMAAAEEQGLFDCGTDRANEERKLIVEELLESD